MGMLDAILKWAGRGLIALGVVVGLAPVWSAEALLMVVGLVLLLTGLLGALHGWRLREVDKGSVAFVAGVAALVTGSALLFAPGAGLSVARWMLLAYLVVSGVCEAALALRLRPHEGWAETLGSALLSLVAAAVLLTGWPISGARAIGIVVGVRLVSWGYAVVRVHRAFESAGLAVAGVRDRLRQGP